jgi:3-oxoacyl-[acyl-carrier protein] reductase
MKTLSSPRRILITGASRGIGRETARMLARRGHNVVLAARDREALAQLAGEIEQAGGAAEVLPLDVTDDASVAHAVRQLLEGGACEVVVNNAGTCDQREFILQPVAAQRAEMELNYWGALRVTRALLPDFIRRRRGLVVNVSSLLGSIASPTTAGYGASKAALESWSFALRAELARFGVGVTVFVAPHTQTELGKATEFDGVVSLPVAYVATELIRAIDRAPRKYAASPVYRFLLWLGRMFPAFMEARVGAGTKRLWSPDPLAGVRRGHQ